MKQKRRLASRVGATVMALLLTAAVGCTDGTTSNTSTAAQTVKLTLWGAADDQTMLREMVDSFQQAHPDKTYDITLRVTGENVAKDEALKDIDAAADVFSIGHDQLGALVEAGAVYENTKYADDIQNSQSENALLAAQYNGKYYGYPYSIDTYFLYYDKSKLSADDVKSLEGILAKKQDDGVAKLGYDLSDGYFAAAFFFTNGCTLFGDKGDDKTQVDFNNAQGVQVGNYIAGLKEKGVVNIDSDTAGTQFKSGKLAAMVSGPWKSDSYQEYLGDNYGVAVLPTVRFDKEDKAMVPFSGLKMYVVNAKTDAPLEAMALANYLTNEENQLKRFNDRALLPTNKAVAANPDVIDDPTVAVILEQVKTARVMPALPQMSNFWDPTAAFAKDAFDGKISAGDMQSKLDKLVSDIKG